MSKTAHFFIFDVDGVITNPHNSAFSPAVVAIIRSLLAEGNLVGINTGRSYAWLQEHLLGHLLEGMDQAGQSHLAIACQKGGELITWSHGSTIPTQSPFALTPAQYNLAKQIFFDHDHEFKTMFWDTSKTTMATIEKRPDVPLAKYHQEQKVLADILVEAFAASNEKVKVDCTTISTDIESVAAGKYAGSRLLHEWSATKPMIVTSRTCFGDSASDYAMAQFFSEQAIPVTFVFVGKESEELPQHDQVTIIRPGKIYEDGTLAFLRDLQ